MRVGGYISIGVIAIAVVWMLCAPSPPTFTGVRDRWRPSDLQLLDRYGEPVHELRIDRYGRRLAWTSLDEISPALNRMVVAAEDHRFWSHRGVDFVALLGSVSHALTDHHGRGASTITMQLASLLDSNFARTNAPRTVFQKLRQIRAALAIERSWTKREILEAYLNLVTYRGELQGVGAAARVMFAKSPHGIDASEAAILAALIRAPNARRDSVARRAEALLAKPEFDSSPRDGVSAAIDRAFAEHRGAFARITLAPHLAERLMRGRTGALRSTLDRDLQRFAAETLRRHVAEVRDRRVDDGAVIVIENATGEVWAYVGGAGDLSAAPYFDTVRAIRQPGSTLKPFLYALALHQHLLTAASMLEDTPLEISEPRGIYRPLDYDRRFHGLVSMRTALASSLNVPAVRTADLIGLEPFARNLRQLGFRGLSEEGDYYGAALALGSADVSLWELANAYRTLANRGDYSEPRLIPRASTEDSRTSIYSPQAAFVISDILADRASRSATFGLENSLATRYWSAVKTGTSKDMRDNWCVGFTRRFTVGVWVGNSSGAPMRDVTGVTGAAPVWLDVMNYLNDRLGSREIARPPGVVASVVNFPDAIEPPRREWFIAGTEPNFPAPHLDHQIARITSPTPGTTVALDPDLPPRSQRIAFAARDTPADSRWILDGRGFAPAASIALWPPAPGAHTLTLIDASGRARDSIPFSVRGSNSPAPDDRDAAKQLE
ncbi:MAG: penicillin-binding protein 1C [Candidatus Binatus sp.]|uniref:penicillin-binding protein 1C n=1 Tax=Candidatus Binatus sp. TaxID=2811406 RepID=UPI0027191C11|nr:penicillin-binding protein 1C [Candidatus Binatus sp.]MDO8431522.1 penicillin-binding protein 1C [Candidatus Binatus sp.]